MTWFSPFCIAHLIDESTTDVLIILSKVVGRWLLDLIAEFHLMGKCFCSVQIYFVLIKQFYVHGFITS
jgi:hypothetical protein